MLSTRFHVGSPQLRLYIVNEIIWRNVTSILNVNKHSLSIKMFTVSKGIVLILDNFWHVEQFIGKWTWLADTSDGQLLLKPPTKAWMFQQSSDWGDSDEPSLDGYLTTYFDNYSLPRFRLFITLCGLTHKRPETDWSWLWGVSFMHIGILPTNILLSLWIPLSTLLVLLPAEPSFHSLLLTDANWWRYRKGIKDESQTVVYE